MSQNTAYEGEKPDQSEDLPPQASSQTSSRPFQGQIKGDRFILTGTWLFALSLALLAVYLAWHPGLGQENGVAGSAAYASALAGADASPPLMAASFAAPVDVQIPPLVSGQPLRAISRRSSLLTIIPTRPRETVLTYTVELGDSVFGIAQKFNIKPESVLWANYDQLEDSPDMLSPGMDLRIPPVDGVYYTWQEGDTFEAVASIFEAEAEDIINWSGNQLDLTNPQVEPDESIMIPGGQREFVQWIVPTIPRGNAGVSKAVYGPGACDGGYDGAYGGGFFVWPISNRALSGNDYWSGHLGIDIAAGVGDGIFAADSGVIVFSGWATGGYGYMIMVDHGNGYQTLYAHLSAVSARCGQSVGQGQYIASAGSTGNSTGPHLHFEIRYLGGFLNPWHMLP